MAKKEIVNVNMYNEGTSQKVFKEGFLVALSNHTISIKNNKIYMETPDKIYIANLNQFSFVWNPSFEYIFRNDMRRILDATKLKPGMMKSLFDWTDPIFDELPYPIQSKKQFLQDLQRKLEEDDEYYQVMRDTMLNHVKRLFFSVRKAYIDKFIPMGILVEEDKIPLEYYRDYSPEMLEKLFEEQDFQEREKIEVVSQAFAEERRKQELSGKKSKQPYNTRIVKLINLLPTSEILDVFMSGVLTTEEFTRTRITKKDLLEVPYEELLEILSDKNDMLPDRLKITSKDLVNAYGRTLNGTTLYKLALYGYIEPEDFIEVHEINKALRLTDYEDVMYDDEELRAYYTPSILIGMSDNQRLTPRFMQGFLELQDFENQPEVFKQKSQMLVQELERVRKEQGIEEAGLQDEILHFFDLGLCDSTTAREHIPESLIENKYIDNQLTMEEVFEYYQKGLITEEGISKYYDKEEILEFYQSGQVSGKALRIVRDADFLLQAFTDGKIIISDYLNLYLQGNISINDLSDGLELSEKEIDIASFITEEIAYDKIKELFTHYLIDYASILGLQHQGVLTTKQVEELKTLLNTREFFEELRAGKTYKVVTTRQEEGGTKRTAVSKTRKEKDFSGEVGLISELLGRDVESESYSLIESYNAKGRATSLNNYRIFGNEELDGIIILQKSKKENAVYVMNALQMMYFLHGKENSEGQIEIQNRMKDKAYLKTIEGVEVVEHTEHFARNLVEASARISQKIASRVKIEDGKYVASVDKMVQELRVQYLEDKAKGRED